MLFFRSEEAIEAWCRARGHPVRPAVGMAQLWQLAVRWYGNRMDPDSRRPDAEEIVAILADIGLTGSFWDPRRDRFSNR